MVVPLTVDLFKLLSGLMHTCPRLDGWAGEPSSRSGLHPSSHQPKPEPSRLGHPWPASPSPLNRHHQPPFCNYSWLAWPIKRNHSLVPHLSSSLLSTTLLSPLSSLPSFPLFYCPPCTPSIPPPVHRDHELPPFVPSACTVTLQFDSSSSPTSPRRSRSTRKGSSSVSGGMRSHR